MQLIGSPRPSAPRPLRVPAGGGWGWWVTLKKRSHLAAAEPVLSSSVQSKMALVWSACGFFFFFLPLDLVQQGNLWPSPANRGGTKEMWVACATKYICLVQAPGQWGHPPATGSSDSNFEGSLRFYTFSTYPGCDHCSIGIASICCHAHLLLDRHVRESELFYSFF